MRPCLIHTCHAILQPSRSSQGHSTAVLWPWEERLGQSMAWVWHGKPTTISPRFVVCLEWWRNLPHTAISFVLVLTAAVSRFKHVVFVRGLVCARARMCVRACLEAVKSSKAKGSRTGCLEGMIDAVVMVTASSSWQRERGRYCSPAVSLVHHAHRVG